MRKFFVLMLTLAAICCAMLVLTACGECKHTDVDWEIRKAPTCVEDGVRVGKCNDCGAKLDAEPVPKLGHDEVVIPDEPANCTVGASTGGKRCDRCGIVITAPSVISEPLGHLRKENACECDRCGATMEHDYNTWTVLREESCVQTGEKERTCKVCGHYDSLTVSALPHTEEIIVEAEATCTRGGMSAGLKCSVCDQVLTIPTPIDALGHNFVNGKCTRCEKADNATQGLEFELAKNGKGYVVTGYKANADLTHLVIPSAYNNKPVVGIANYAFRSTDTKPLHIVSAEIPFTVQSIGNYAFSGNRDLETVVFEENSRCNEILSSFVNCTALTEITLPTELTKLVNAFFRCSSLRHVNIPKNTRQIDGTSFALCPALEEIIIDEDNEYFTMKNGALYSNDGTLVHYLVANPATEFVVPNTVTKIEDYCFYDAPHLTTITFENGSVCTEIANYSFEDIDGLQEITIPKSVKVIRLGALSCCDNLRAVYFEAESLLESCGDRAFAECPALTECVLPQRVEYLDQIFADSPNVESAQVLPNVKYLRNSFNGCSKITSIDLTGNEVLTTIEGAAFRGTGIASIFLPKTLTEIPKETFKDCVMLTTVMFAADSVCGAIKQEAFCGCVKLEEIHIPDTVTTIGQQAFCGCIKLTTVEFLGAGSAPSTIGNQAFMDCTSLTTVTLANNLNNIGTEAFKGCVKLRKIVIPQSVQIIGDYAFDKCYEIIQLGHDGITYDKLEIYCEVAQSACPTGWGYYFNYYIDNNGRPCEYNVTWG